MTFTLYSKPGCHLCDEMKALLAPLLTGADHRLDIVDITTDPALFAQYADEIPVLLADGREVAKYRIDEQSLRRILERGSERA